LQYGKNKEDVLADKKRCYLHLYYNIEQATEEEVAFDRHLMELRKELLEDRRVADNETQYQKSRNTFFIRILPNAVFKYL